MTDHVMLFRTAKATWIVAMSAVLALWLYGISGSSHLQALTNGESHMLAILLLIILTFPLGVVWALALNFSAYFVERAAPPFVVSDTLLVLVAWGGFFLVGHWQWFTLLPSVVRWWRKHSARKQ